MRQVHCGERERNECKREREGERNVKREFLVERQGKSFVLYAGLLDEAHSQGLKSIRTKLLQIPNPENGHVAICNAEVETEKGTFTGIGDAAPENVSRLMVPHLIRMAETRAKARALRDSINVGVVALEELGEVDDINASTGEGETDRWAPEATGGSQPRNGHGFHQVNELGLEQVSAKGAPRPWSEGTRAGAATSSAANPAAATPAQVRAIYLIARDQHGLSEPQVEERSMAAYGCLPSELTKKQASELITSLKR